MRRNGFSGAVLALPCCLAAAACGSYQSADQELDAGPDATDCEPGVERAGCPCDVAEPVWCYPAPEETRGVGPCAPGLRACVGGVWTECEGEVVPADETCNGVDDDCDGRTDEGVLSECGNCDPLCEVIRWGHEEGDLPFDLELGTCVALDDSGAVVIDPPPTRQASLWVPNTAEGTLSRIGTRDRVELARFRTGEHPLSDSPSRTSVDYMNSCYVANRAPGGQASVAKFWENDCPDVDGDRVVETSSGGDDILPFGEDECLHWHVAVGEEDAVANALASQARVGLDGVLQLSVWVGLANEQRYLQLDDETGEETGISVDAAPCTPHGAALDRDGNLWSACGSAQVFRFDTWDPEDHEVIEQPGGNEGIAVDQDGRVWTGGIVSVFDPEFGEWAVVPGLRGYGVAADGEGSIWVGDCERDGIGVGTCRVDAGSLEVGIVRAASRAVAVDWWGNVWGVPTSGTLDVFDAYAAEPDVETVLDDCDGPGGACLDGPDAYSDMAGIGPGCPWEPYCYWSTVAPPCPEGTEATWIALDWNVEVVEHTLVIIEVRTADSPEELAAATWVGAAAVPPDEPPVSLESLLGPEALRGLLEVRVHLQASDRNASPVVHSIGLMRSCH